MSTALVTDESYREWITDVSKRFRGSQIKVALHVNEEMLRFYWSLGKDMESRKELSSWGGKFYDQVSRDLQRVLPDVKSFSPRNLRYMHKYYRMFPEHDDAEPSRNQAILQQPVAEINMPISTSNLSSPSEPPREVFLVPWGHIVRILDKSSDNKAKALFYVRKTLENNWPRAVLMDFLDSNLFERQGKAATNFTATLPDAQGSLAQALTKDPYSFDFLAMRERYDEKELKDALMANAEQFFRELGSGFAFLGREVRLEVGNREKFVDLLFYHVKQHCYVVVEVKATDFDAAYAGQLGTYVVAVNHTMRTGADAPTIGILICKGMDRVEAQYALESSSQPLGISSYELSKLIPERFKGSLPTIEEIEEEFGSD